MVGFDGKLPKKSDGNLPNKVMVIYHGLMVIFKIYPRSYGFMVIFMPWYSLRLKDITPKKKTQIQVKVSETSVESQETPFRKPVAPKVCATQARPFKTQNRFDSVRRSLLGFFSQDMDFSGFHRISIYPAGNPRYYPFPGICEFRGGYTPAKLTASLPLKIPLFGRCCFCPTNGAKKCAYFQGSKLAGLVSGQENHFPSSLWHSPKHGHVSGSTTFPVFNRSIS